MSLISDRLEIGLSINTTNWRICLVLYFLFWCSFHKTAHFWGTRPFITENLLMGRKESNQTNKATKRKHKKNDRGQSKRIPVPAVQTFMNMYQSKIPRPFPWN